MAPYYHCKIMIDGSKTVFDALDTGKRWNGWFDGWIELTTSVQELFSELTMINETDVGSIPSTWIDGKWYISTKGYTFYTVTDHDTLDREELRKEVRVF